jgi:hypothetical protein
MEQSVTLPSTLAESQTSLETSPEAGIAGPPEGEQEAELMFDPYRL